MAKRQLMKLCGARAQRADGMDSACIPSSAQRKAGTTSVARRKKRTFQNHVLIQKLQDEQFLDY